MDYNSNPKTIDDAILMAKSALGRPDSSPLYKQYMLKKIVALECTKIRLTEVARARLAA